MPPDELPDALRTQLASLITTQQYTAATVQDIRTEVHQAQQSISAILIKMAEMPSMYTSQQAHGQVLDRLDALERAKDSGLPRFEALVQDVAMLTKKVSDLATAQDRRAGGWQWLQIGIALAFTLGNLLLASKGKLW